MECTKLTHGRRDCNHAEIRDALRKGGYYVKDTGDYKGGFPDLLVTSKSDIGVLMEVKMPGEKLTKAEEKFWDEYRGPLELVFSVEEAFEAMQAWDERSVNDNQR